MPAERIPAGDVARRRLLAGVGSTALFGLSGCSGRLPGTDPERLAVETTVEEGQHPRVLWEYPTREDDADGIGYAAVEVNRIVARESRSPELRLNFNSTIGRIASDPPYEGYHPDWFRFQIWPPVTYGGALNYEFRVEPPGGFDGFSTDYETRSQVRRSTVELDHVGTQGTIQIPAVLDPGGNPRPDQLHCSFTVQASRSGFLGNTVRVTDQAVLPVP